MAHKLHPAARRAILDIWQYTYRTWGAEQADRYVRGLYEMCDQLAENRIKWRAVPHPEAAGVYVARYEHHFIFFRQLTDGRLGIISILHENMDLPTRLHDDLKSEPDTE